MAQYHHHQQYGMRHLVEDSRTLPRPAQHPPALRTQEALSMRAAGQRGRAPLPPHWDLRGPATMTRAHSAQNLHDPAANRMHVVNISFDGPPRGAPTSAGTMSRVEGRATRDTRAMASNDGNWIFRTEGGNKRGRGNAGDAGRRGGNTLAMRNMAVSQQMEKEQLRRGTNHKVTAFQYPPHVARAMGGGGGGGGRTMSASSAPQHSPPHPPAAQRSHSHDDILSRGGDRVQVQRDFRRDGSPGLNVPVPAYNRSPSTGSTPPVSPFGLQRSPPSPGYQTGVAGQIIYVQQQQSPGSPHGGGGYAVAPQSRYIRKVSRTPSEVSHLSSATSSSRVSHQEALSIQVPPPSPGGRLQRPSRSNSVPDLVDAGGTLTTPRTPTTPAHLDAVVPPPSTPSPRRDIDAIVDPGGSIRNGDYGGGDYGGDYGGGAVASADSVYSGTFVRVKVKDYSRTLSQDDGALTTSNLRDMRRHFHSEPSLLDPAEAGLRTPPETSGTIARAFSPGR